MDKPIVIFSYKIDDLLEELTKRTSYMGKMRGSEQEPLMIDRLSLTQGEHFMFTEFLHDAVSNTYEWLQAFGRNVKYSNKCDIVYEDCPIYKDFGATLTVGGGSQLFGKWIKVSSFNHSDIGGGVISYDCEDIKIDSLKEKVKVVLNFRYTVYSLLDGLECKTLVEDRRIFNLPVGDDEVIQGGSYPFECNEHGDYHNIYRVDMEVKCETLPTTIVALKKGQYVEHRTDFSNDSVFDVYQILRDCTNEDWKDNADKLEYDPRGSVVFMLECCEYFDENKVFSIDRNIKEAIINYILFRWYEFVLPTEYQNYYLKFEDYAYKAKVGMNSTVKLIQRKHNTF